MKKKTFVYIITVLILAMMSLNVFAKDIVQSGSDVTSLLSPSIEKQADKKDAKQSEITSGRGQSESLTALKDDQKVVNNPTDKTKASTLTKATSSSDLPKAGLSPVITMTMVGIVGLAAFLYRKVVKYNI